MNEKDQDNAAASLLFDIVDETNTIDYAAQNNNIKLMTQSLHDLRSHPNIQVAELYSYKEGSFTNSSDGVFASQLNPSQLEGMQFLNNLHLKLKSSKQIVFPGSDLTILDPIGKNDAIIGATYVKASLGYDLDIRNLIEIVILLTIITIFIGRRLSESILEPLLSLDHVMENVIIENDYSIRAKKSSHDEIGNLTNTFNLMLEKIQGNEQLQRISQEQIKRLAYYDTLTELPNRDFFIELLQQALLDAKIDNQLVAVLFFDLDNFKRINDIYGHGMGDIVLQNTTRNIQKCLRAMDPVGLDSTHIMNNAILARLSGDEFIIVLKNIKDIKNIKFIADQILKSIYQPYMAKGKEIIITASIGIALYPTHGDNANDLIKNADIAMYSAKENGKGHYAIFNDKMSALLINKIGLENDLRLALNQNELVLFYEPQFGLLDNTIIGFEALLRWNHPTRGFLLPGEFITVAEHTGLIINIGSWILREACIQCKKWHDSGFPNIHISVNLSPRQFSDPNLITTLKQALADTQLEPSYLQLELTEGMVLLNDQKTLDMLDNFKNIGIKISIDDFGTGYSSLRYLSQYPIDILKIDKTFISYVNESQKNSTLTKAIIDLAHNLNLSVVAEGVETMEQLNYLKENKCDVIQGYIISHPVPEKDVPILLSKYLSKTHA